MANSKSSIYPIQLKNAELNLNKYDAEIKQYTGFNKNNAPFVGGCLSNLFVKGITDPSMYIKNNMYIDEEGNIYRVYQDALKKNENTILKWDRNSYAFEKSKIDTPENCLRVYSDKIYLIKSVNKIILKVFNVSYEIKELNGMTDDAAAYNNSYGIFVEHNNVNLFVFAFYGEQTKKVYFFNCSTGVLLRSYSATNQLNYIENEPISILYNSSSSQVLIVARAFNSYHHFNYVDVFNANSYGLIAEDVTSFASSYPVANYRYLPDLQYWRFHSYPFNNATLYNTFDGGDGASGRSVMGKADNIDYSVNAEGLWIGSPTYFDTQYIVSFFECDYVQDENLIDGTIESLTSCYDYQLQTRRGDETERKYFCAHYAPNTYRFIGFNYSDFTYKVLSEDVTIKRGKYVLADKQRLGTKFFLLFNNNKFSGIAGYHVLLTNWNSVELKTLSFKSVGTVNGEELYFKEGDTWYKLYNGLPSLKCLNNQVIVNIDTPYNSWDIKRNKALAFAPAFNGFFCTIRTAPGFFDNTADNNRTIAASINEYNLEDNASILLNPIAFAVFGSGQWGDPTQVFNPQINIPVNYYTDAISKDTNLQYWGTVLLLSDMATQKLFYNKDLLGLFYPLTTSGNVLYSANLFIESISNFGNNYYIKTGNKAYPLVINNDLTPVFSFYLGNELEGVENIFIIQGQAYAIINKYIYSVTFNNGVISSTQCVVSVEGLQFCGNTPYQAIFFSKTNRCLYAFTGANVLNVMQTIDKISEVKDYKYNPATQSIFLITDTGVIINGLFGTYQIDYPNIDNLFLLKNGFVLRGNNYVSLKYFKYYKDTDDGYTKQNIELDTCFYGMDNQTVTINDCLYLRLFSEEHEEGSLEVSAVTLSLKGRKTEKTTFKIKAGDWDKETHTIYLRYQPKEQRGLGISFKINSPFKIASMSVGSQPDAILIDKVSKGAVNAPLSTSSNINW